MVKPAPILPQPTPKPPRELPEIIDKPPVQVLDTPLNFAFIPRTRRISAMDFNPVASTPSPPLLLELRSVIGQYRLRGGDCPAGEAEAASGVVGLVAAAPFW